MREITNEEKYKARAKATLVSLPIEVTHSPFILQIFPIFTIRYFQTDQRHSQISDLEKASRIVKRETY